MQIAIAEPLAEIMEIHLEELGFLWSQWLAAIRCSDSDQNAITDLQGRIEAHTDGLVAMQEDAFWLLGPAVRSDNPMLALARDLLLAAYEQRASGSTGDRCSASGGRRGVGGRRTGALHGSLL